MTVTDRPRTSAAALPPTTRPVPIVRHDAHAPAKRREAGVRNDIQALRAAAVTMVLVYHLWPNRLTGGFTGVDVFFVISGFLITSHLLAKPPQRLGDLLAFWSRRIRRLLPASLLVLVVTLGAARLFAPETVWSTIAVQVRAAALYAVNWRLADDSVDYLASQNAPTPVQHFWSLSVEEQFYLVWPVLILVLIGVARLLRRRPAPFVLVGLLVVVGLSLAYSVHETAVEPARAYFVTPTRVWELGTGGVVAALLSRRALGRTRDDEGVPLPLPARSLLAWAGWAVLAVSAVVYTGALPFPSWTAAVPVLGAAAVIAAAARPGRLSPDRFTRLRPVQWLGDVSYSLYLWHWPLLVILPMVLGHSLRTVDKLAVIAGALVLAFLTKRFVEDRFRTPAWGRPVWKPYVLAAAAMAVVVAGAQLQLTEVAHRTEVAQQQLDAKLTGSTACFGAAALAASSGACPEIRSGALYPAPVEAAKSQSDAWDVGSSGKDCFAHRPSFPVTSCTHGAATATVRVALVGNSHAAQWYPTLKAVADQRHWQVTTFIASQCALADLTQNIDTPAHDAACRTWGRKVVDKVVHGGFDLVVMSNRVSVTAVGAGSKQASLPRYEQGYERVLKAFSAAHLRVVDVRDTPAPGALIPDCLAAHTSDYTACDGTRATWLPADPSVQAVRAVGDPRQRVVDLTDLICGPTTCPAAAGSVPVYFDGSHLTRVYARTLAPYLSPRLAAALQG
ncbi:acyltransferase family protein [Amnibacterium sp. CER49]|uniref:acyltransferase family protein n=1 Tax=Amnibacterium sp. CER49 TaxID=3039161 RepID=UPI0024480199|nr:acyltransferase family protein [Amnibacterium sp. CER49]MDH2443967.1 acyltransferase family protein [Amnibacterium sp. CER49]